MKTASLPGGCLVDCRLEAVLLPPASAYVIEIPIWRLYLSPTCRAVETVQIAFADTPIAIHLDERLRECNYGDLNGCAIAVLTGLRSRHIDLPFPGGQSYRQVVTATASFLNDLKSRWDDSRVLVVAHSGNKWALDCLLDGKELENLVGSPFEWKEGWVYVLDRSCSELSQTKQ